MSLRVALICDLREEAWASMDLVADMLALHLPQVDPGIQVEQVRPAMVRRATRVPLVGGTAAAFALDRYWNRYLDCTWNVSRLRDRFDVFHVIDHSYAHLVHALPAGKTVVTCHDTDAFRGAMTGERGRGPYRLIAPRLVSGLRRATLVTCDTVATRDDLADHDLLSPDRAVVIHNGVAPDMRNGDDPAASRRLEALIGPPSGIELLHVGSTIERKRIDVLIEAFAEARRTRADLRLLKAGGALTSRQRGIARRFGVEHAIVHVPPLEAPVLAALYRRAVLTLLPSDREGFGLPVVESLACGTPVLASSIAALVEIGGAHTAYAPPGEPAAWARAMGRLLDEREQEPGWWSHRREEGRRHAASFSWAAYAREMAAVYSSVFRYASQEAPLT